MDGRGASNGAGGAPTSQSATPPFGAPWWPPSTEQRLQERTAAAVQCCQSVWGARQRSQERPRSTNIPWGTDDRNSGPIDHSLGLVPALNQPGIGPGAVHPTVFTPPPAETAGPTQSGSIWHGFAQADTHPAQELAPPKHEGSGPSNPPPGLLHACAGAAVQAAEVQQQIEHLPSQLEALVRPPSRPIQQSLPPQQPSQPSQPSSRLPPQLSSHPPPQQTHLPQHHSLHLREGRRCDGDGGARLSFGSERGAPLLPSRHGCSVSRRPVRALTAPSHPFIIARASLTICNTRRRGFWYGCRHAAVAPRSRAMLAAPAHLLGKQVGYFGVSRI